MTNPISPDQIRKAKKWVEHTKDKYGTAPAATDFLSAVKLIESLPETIVDGDKLQEVIELWSSEPLTSETAPFMVEQLRDLLPAPALPTLADMSPEERKACKWMQAEIYDNGFIGILTEFSEIRQEAKYLCSGGEVSSREYRVITPLPDLSKLEWPSMEVQA